MRALIIGVAGQDGFYLKELLTRSKIECIGLSRSNGDWITGDVSNRQFVEVLVRRYEPDYIFHLAANSTIRHEAVIENHDTISTGAINILEAVYKYSRKTKVFLSGSGLQFINKGMPISENDSFDASSAYSVSRVHSVYAARYYRTLGLKVYVGYFFNHDSPFRSERHVNQKIVQALKRIANGSNETLQLGDISVMKEFGFSGDIVKAIWMMMNNDEIFEAVIGTGKAYSIQDWLDVCAEYLSLDWKQNTKFEEAPTIHKHPLVSDPTSIMRLGWTPQVNIHQLADLMVNT